MSADVVIRVVDDDQSFRTAVCRVLRAAGFAEAGLADPALR